MHSFYFFPIVFVQKCMCSADRENNDQMRGPLHGIMGLAVLQRLSLFLWFVLQIVPLLQIPEHHAVEDVLVGLLDQLLKQPQRHDADLETGSTQVVLLPFDLIPIIN